MKGLSMDDDYPERPFIATRGYDIVVGVVYTPRTRISKIIRSISEFNYSIWRIDVGMSSGVLDSRPEDAVNELMVVSRVDSRRMNLDNRRMDLVSAPLTGNNFLSWSRSMKIALVAKVKLGFMNGKYTKPDEDSDEFE